MKLTAGLLLTSLILFGCAGHKEPGTIATAAAPTTSPGTDGAGADAGKSAPSAPADTELAASVRKALGVDGGLVLIEAHQGVVTLHGTIDTKLHKDAIVKKAKGVPGVVSVDDKTKVVNL